MTASNQHSGFADLRELLTELNRMSASAESSAAANEGYAIIGSLEEQLEALRKASLDHMLALTELWNKGALPEDAYHPLWQTGRVLNETLTLDTRFETAVSSVSSPASVPPDAVQTYADGTTVTQRYGSNQDKSPD